MPYILIGEPAHRKFADTLQSCGFAPIALPRDESLNRAVASHADTLIFSDGSKHIINNEYITRLPEAVRVKLTPSADKPYGNYPNDTAFNAMRIGSYLFARRTSLAASVREHADQCGLTLINVSQGYTKCSTLALPSARAAVTADKGMAKAMESVGIDVLRISAGHIALEGCEYGFIGGASFVWEPHNFCSLSRFGRYVYFFGDLLRHHDGETIANFIHRHGYEVISLGGELTDFGGAVVVE